MCLAVPGKILSLLEEPHDDPLGPFAKVDFQGSRVEVSLQMVPDAAPGDWILVHAGFALQKLDPDEAREIWEYLEMAELAEEMPLELRPEQTAE